MASSTNDRGGRGIGNVSITGDETARYACPFIFHVSCKILMAGEEIRKVR